MDDNVATKARARDERSAVGEVLHVLVDRPAQLASFRRRVREMLSEQGLSAEEREAIVLAAVEALSNALQVCRVTDCHIEVSLSLIADYVCVEVSDATEGFKGVCVDLIEDADEDAEHGRGLYLMRELMESLELVPRPRGTLVRMIRKLEAREARGDPRDPER